MSSYKFLIFFLLCILSWKPASQLKISARKISSEESVYTQKIQKIFDNRCIACHSCLESPCQLNLQSHEGLKRGIHTQNVLTTRYVEAGTPTRLYEDAHSVAEWRKLGFSDVIGETSHYSTLVTALEMRQQNKIRVTTEAEKSKSCYSQDRGVNFLHKVPKLGMPYGLNPLSAEEIETIRLWVDSGALPPKKEDPLSFSPTVRTQIQEWISFFNKKSLKGRIISRYLYEHFFLAHFYFKDSPREFFKIIRSSTSCEAPTMITTRTPNADPEIHSLYYCFIKVPGTIVYKTHIPYELSTKKLQWLSELFYTNDWSPTKFPSYDLKYSSNPFLTFKEIPVRARYKFLLEDARYHVMTFLKGPVCSGSAALNSIQEQFFVAFMSPSSDLMVRDKKFAKAMEELVILPGKWSEEVPLDNAIAYYLYTLKKRADYRKVYNSALERTSPKGLTVKDLWDGHKTNPNALLTIMRHNENGGVFPGAKGDLSKTAFVLDYSTFERLVYNLVVNYDAYGNIGHKFLSRLYMEIIRIDSENNMLNFLPPNERVAMKEWWYKGVLSDIKVELMNEKEFAKIPSGTKFERPTDTYKQFWQKFIYGHLKDTRIPDELNWKTLATTQPRNEIHKKLKRISSVKGAEKLFPTLFPEVSLLFIGDSIYSVMRNREHTNLSWINGESKRLSPSEDTLTIVEGIWISHPNLFFKIDENELEAFTSEVLALKDESQYTAFLKKYAVDRMDERFWNLYDKTRDYFERTNPIEGGYLDLSRYALELRN